MNRSHLIAQKVVDKKGFSRTVYVRPEPSSGFGTKFSLPPRSRETNGYHWEDASNPRIAELVKKIKRGNEKLDASFPVLISNKGGEVILGATDELDAVDIYTRGACSALAFAGALASGLPVAVFDDKDPIAGAWSGHVAVVVGDDEYLDINGVSSASSLNSYFGGKLNKPIHFESPIEAQRHISGDKFDGDDIADYLTSNINELGWLVTLDFVQTVFDESGIPVDSDILSQLGADWHKS